MVLSGYKFERYRDLKSIRPLYLLANVLAIAPSFNFEKRDYSYPTFFKYYAAIMLLASIVPFSWSLYHRFLYVFTEMTTTTIVADVFVSIALTSNTFMAMITISIWKKDQFKKFLLLLMKFDERFSILGTTQKSNRQFYMEMIGYYAFITFVYGIDSYVWIGSVGILRHEHYIFQYFQFYQLTTLSYFVYNFVSILRDRFALVNEKLVASFKVPNNLYMSDDGGTLKKITNSNFQNEIVREVTMLYTSLCDMVDVFNSIFGLLILLLIVNIILGLVEPINFAFVFTKSGINGVHFGGDLISVSTLLATMFMICGLMIASACDGATKEAKRTSYLSYKLSQNRFLSRQQHEIREDLMMLANQASQHTPIFTAAGCFTVDYTMLLRILGSVSTYLIVLIQLN